MGQGRGLFGAGLLSAGTHRSQTRRATLFKSFLLLSSVFAGSFSSGGLTACYCSRGILTAKMWLTKVPFLWKFHYGKGKRCCTARPQSLLEGKKSPPRGLEGKAVPILADITSKRVQSTRDANPNEEFMKVKELIRETSVWRNYDSGTKINHAFRPPAALARCQSRLQTRGLYVRAGRKPDCLCTHAEEGPSAAACGCKNPESSLTGADCQPLTTSAKRTGQPALRTWRLFFQPPAQDFSR